MSTKLAWGLALLEVLLQTEHLIGTSAHGPQRPMVRCTGKGTDWLLRLHPKLHAFADWVLGVTFRSAMAWDPAANMLSTHIGTLHTPALVSVLIFLFSFKLGGVVGLSLAFCTQEKIELREDLKSRRGLAVSLEIICHNCGESTMSSKISNKCYDVNVRLTYGMRAIGKGGAAAIFCGLMNLPPPPAKFERHNSLFLNVLKTI
ncbi:uncharacterized protein TNCV_3579181 [Trichonephila clavipes]|nr:uncharacterized protein TNCV_3579181 [Trichonephila clavipes]